MNHIYVLQEIEIYNTLIIKYNDYICYKLISNILMVHILICITYVNYIFCLPVCIAYL